MLQRRIINGVVPRGPGNAPGEFEGSFFVTKAKQEG